MTSRDISKYTHFLRVTLWWTVIKEKDRGVCQWSVMVKPNDCDSTQLSSYHCSVASLLLDLGQVIVISQFLQYPKTRIMLPTSPRHSTEPRPLTTINIVRVIDNLHHTGIINPATAGSAKVSLICLEMCLHKILLNIFVASLYLKAPASGFLCCDKQMLLTLWESFVSNAMEGGEQTIPMTAAGPLSMTQIVNTTQHLFGCLSVY